MAPAITAHVVNKILPISLQSVTLTPSYIWAPTIQYNESNTCELQSNKIYKNSFIFKLLKKILIAALDQNSLLLETQNYLRTTKPRILRVPTSKVAYNTSCLSDHVSRVWIFA